MEFEAAELAQLKNESAVRLQRGRVLERQLSILEATPKITTQLSRKSRAIFEAIPGVNKELSIAGAFILYSLANSYLFNDFERCNQICNTNFSYLANSNFFEGNILRFKGLALE